MLMLRFRGFLTFYFCPGDDFSHGNAYIFSHLDDGFMDSC